MAQLCERLVELGALPETFEPLHRWARVRLLATLLEEARGGPGPGGAEAEAEAGAEAMAGQPGNR